MEQIVRIVQILVALGLVIFVHELGHYLVAVWSGVYVERFSIGFGPVLLRWKRKETEYVLSAIPLGGYVKMLGEHPEEDQGHPVDDERSFQNKPVGKRMAIISAGVIMNIIFGFFCFAIAYQLGVPYLPATIGAAIPGKPAWKAGARAGDEVYEINGRSSTTYEMLLNEVALTTPGRELVHLKVERNGQKFEFRVSPVQDEMRPRIGVAPASGLELYPEEPTRPHSPAQRAADGGFEAGGTIEAVNGKPVYSHREFVDAMFAHQAEKVRITLKRTDSEGKASTTEVEVEPNFVRGLGLQMQMGPVVAIQENSPAARAIDLDGKPAPLLPNDLIKAIDGQKDFDPMRLPDLLTAKAGQKVELKILRPETDRTEQKEMTIVIIPEAIPTWIDFPESPSGLSPEDPTSIPSIGVAYNVVATVQKVEPSSPAATAEKSIQPGDTIKQVELFFDVKGKEESGKVDVAKGQWTAAFWAMQFPEIRRVQLTVQRPGGEAFDVALQPKYDETWPFRLRGFQFNDLNKVRKEASFREALVLGYEKTRESVIQIYLFLRSLIITRTISPKNLLGPITIARVAYSIADNFPKMIEFFGLLSINLAIINFLPIPILDGGHMLFLLIELVMRRKPSQRVLLIANYIGLLLIAMLMLYVLGLDLTRLDFISRLF